MKLGVCVALWRRQAIARLALRRIARAFDGRATLVAITDEHDNGAEAARWGFEVEPAPNAPLSNKWNAGARRLRGRVDALIVLGSDNWICDRLPAAWARQMRAQPIVGVLDSWQVCLHRPEALWYPGYTKPGRAGESIGAARALRADVLDGLDWQPWEPDLDRGLDGGMRRRLRARGHDARGRLQVDLGVRVLGIKSAEGMTPAERFMRAAGSRLVSRAAALAPFPTDERRDLESLATY